MVTKSSSRPADLVRLVYNEHRLILWLSTGYVLLGGFTLKLFGRPWPIAVPQTYLEFFAAWTTCTGAWLLWQYMRSPARLRRAIVLPRLCGAVLLALIVVPTQITFQALKQSIGHVVTFRSDVLLYKWGLALHGRMAWEWFLPVLRHPLAVIVLDDLYMLWFVGLFAFLMWACWTQSRTLRQRAVTAFLLMWIVPGTLVAAILPSAGPCYLAQAVPGATQYQPLIARLDSIGSQWGPLHARINQRNIWDFSQRDQWAPFAGISAMPSLHVAIAVLYFLIARRRSRLAGVLLGAYAILVQIGSIVLGWHYAVDGYAGALLAVACWKAADVMAKDAGSADAVEAIIANTVPERGTLARIQTACGV